MPDDSLKEFILDQLRALPELRARRMFGAHGLYSGDKFFGILEKGRLFFKTDAQSRREYTMRGMGAFTYEAKGKIISLTYYEVPPEVLENAAELTAWAQRAIQLAGQKTARKNAPRKSGKAPNRST